MLRLMISQSGLHSNHCRVAGVGRTNSHRALTGSVLLLLAALFLLSSYTWAQEVTASIVGTVVDPNGAAVSGATITARDLDRGAHPYHNHQRRWSIQYFRRSRGQVPGKGGSQGISEHGEPGPHHHSEPDSPAEFPVANWPGERDH